MKIKVHTDWKIHGETVRSALGSNLVESFDNADAAIFFPATPQHKETVEWCKQRGIITAVYWMGQEAKKAVINKIWRDKLPKYDLQFCVHERLKLELDTVDLFASTIYFFPKQIPSYANAPMMPMVAAYLPNLPNYMPETVTLIADKVPDIKFLIYGNKEPYKNLPGNCEQHGWVTPEKASEILKMSTCVLRVTAHDGFPQNVIEMKMRDRHAVTNYFYQGCLHGKTIEDFVQILKDKKTHLPDVSFWPMWYRAHCSPETFRKRVVAKFTGKMGK